MLSSFFAATVRHRRIVLVVETVLAAVFVVVESRTRAFTWIVFPWLIVAAMVCLVLVIVVQKSQRPAGLTVRPDGSSFDTPVSPLTIFLFTGYVGIAMVNTTSLVRSLGEGEEWWQLDAALIILYLVVLALWFRAGWDHVGVRLRRDGVLDRGPAGSLFVPWEAFDLHYPAWPADRGDRLRLNYEGPARVRGITRRRFVTGVNVDRWFLAGAIEHYVTHPKHRAAIGTEAEYRRLMQALASPAEQHA